MYYFSTTFHDHGFSPMGVPTKLSSTYGHGGPMYGPPMDDDSSSSSSSDRKRPRKSRREDIYGIVALEYSKD